VHDVGVESAFDGAALVAEAPYDVWKVTPFPSEVPSNSSNTGTLAASSTE
jgi:hypothetical protein